MNYWQERWLQQQTGWDLGGPSAPLVTYLSQIPVEKRQTLRILMPGCGNGYEAIWMAQNGFEAVTMLDIAQAAVDLMEKRSTAELTAGEVHPQVVCSDFFEFMGQFDLILEQTFFCALDPSLREKYVSKMYELLAPGGKLAGVLFDCTFPAGPPFGGDRTTYTTLFSPFFHLHTFDACHNSVAPRAGTELFVIFEKN